MENETTSTILVKLRSRMNDLLRMGIVPPEGFGMYQQTVLQLLQEYDRRKQTCLAHAEQLKTQAAAMEAQAHAFIAAGSVLFSVVNGYIDLEERRIREEQERKATEEPREEPKAAAPPKKKRRSKKPDEGASASPPGAGPDAPDEG